MAQLIIPTSPIPHNEFTVDLEEKSWRARTRWNETDAAWYLDLEGLTDTRINFKGLKLVPGCNLLRPFAITQLGGLYVLDREGSDQNPNYDDFGTQFVLLYVGLDEPESIW